MSNSSMFDSESERISESGEQTIFDLHNTIVIDAKKDDGTHSVKSSDTPVKSKLYIIAPATRLLGLSNMVRLDKQCGIYKFGDFEKYNKFTIDSACDVH